MSTKPKKGQRYKRLKSYKGICKDMWSEMPKYYVYKTINGKNYSTTCKTIPEAVAWRNTYHPSLAFSEISESTPTRRSLKERCAKVVKKVTTRTNGEDLGYKFEDIWELYQSRMKRKFMLIEKIDFF